MAYPSLDSKTVTLKIRQQPKRALVIADKASKGRKAVDPPPIVQLEVSDYYGDDQRTWLVSPYTFMKAVLVEPNQENGAFKPVPRAPLTGQTSSSLYRLKDLDGATEGFFIFGDISCRCHGKYRLLFHLFDFDKVTRHVVFVRSIVSEPFHVDFPKDFCGQMQSTALSKSFSKQGVSLRLRRARQTSSGKKRSLEDSLAGSRSHSTYYGVAEVPVSDQRDGSDMTAMTRRRIGNDYNPPMLFPTRVTGSHTFEHGIQRHSSGPDGRLWQSHQSLDASQAALFRGSIYNHIQSATDPDLQTLAEQDLCFGLRRGTHSIKRINAADAAVSASEHPSASALHEQGQQFGTRFPANNTTGWYGSQTPGLLYNMTQTPNQYENPNQQQNMDRYGNSDQHQDSEALGIGPEPNLILTTKACPALYFDLLGYYDFAKQYYMA